LTWNWLRTQRAFTQHLIQYLDFFWPKYLKMLIIVGTHHSYNIINTMKIQTCPLQKNSLSIPFWNSNCEWTLLVVPPKDTFSLIATPTNSTHEQAQQSWKTQFRSCMHLFWFWHAQGCTWPWYGQQHDF
jgi:hypothetical protein